MGHSAILEVVHVCSHRDHFLGPDTSEFASSGLIPLRWLSWACSVRGHWLSLLHWRLLDWACSDAQACSRGCPWLRPVSAEVPGLGLIPQWCRAQTYPFGGHSLVLAPTEVTCLGLPRQRFLAQVSGGGHWLGLFLQRSLAQACSCGYPWLRSAPK